MSPPPDIRWQQRFDNFTAVMGDVSPLQAEAIAGELDELPLPYRFEVQPVARIVHALLPAHIDRVGIFIYRAA